MNPIGLLITSLIAGFLAYYSTSLFETSKESSVKRFTAYRETWNELLGESDFPITLRSENGLGLVTTRALEANMTLLELRLNSILTNESDILNRLIPFKASSTPFEAVLIVALALERSNPLSPFTPLWRVTGLDIPDPRTVRLKGIFSEVFTSQGRRNFQVFEIIANKTSMEGWGEESEKMIINCKHLSEAAGLEIPESHLKWALVTLRGYGVRDEYGNFNFFSAPLVFARLSAASSTGIEIVKNDEFFKIITNRPFSPGEEILLPAALWLSDAFTFAYRSVWLLDQHRMIIEFKFPGHIHCDKTPLGLNGVGFHPLLICARGSSNIRSFQEEQKLAKIVHDSIHERIDRFHAANEQIAQLFATQTLVDIPAMRVREIEGRILSDLLKVADEHQKLLSQWEWYWAWKHNQFVDK